MDPFTERKIDEDFGKGAVESESSAWGDPAPEDETREAVALTEDVLNARVEDVKHAEEELGADDDGTPG